MQEMHSKRPKFQNFPGGGCPFDVRCPFISPPSPLVLLPTKSLIENPEVVVVGVFNLILLCSIYFFFWLALSKFHVVKPETHKG